VIAALLAACGLLQPAPSPAESFDCPDSTQALLRRVYPTTVGARDTLPPSEGWACEGTGQRVTITGDGIDGTVHLDPAGHIAEVKLTGERPVHLVVARTDAGRVRAVAKLGDVLTIGQYVYDGERVAEHHLFIGDDTGTPVLRLWNTFDAEGELEEQRMVRGEQLVVMPDLKAGVRAQPQVRPATDLPTLDPDWQAWSHPEL